MMTDLETTSTPQDGLDHAASRASQTSLHLTILEQEGDILPEGSILPQDEARLVVKDLEEHRNTLANASVSPATRKAYASDWRDFFWWCRRLGLPAYPTDEHTLLLYLSDCARLRPFLSGRHKTLKIVYRKLSYATIRRRLNALSFLHPQHSAPHFSASHPPTQRVLKGIARTLGTRSHGKRALSFAQVQSMVDWMWRRESVHFIEERRDELNLRDVAILLLGVCSGRRRSELVALQVEDVEFSEEGVVLLVRRSKTDQLGRGRKFYIGSVDSRYCPVAALRAHLGGRSRGPVFTRLDHAARASVHTGDRPALGVQTIASIIKNAAISIGLNPNDFSAHTLRKTMATLASKNGAPFADIKDMGGWSSAAGVGPYILPADEFAGSLTEKIVR